MKLRDNILKIHKCKPVTVKEMKDAIKDNGKLHYIDKAKATALTAKGPQGIKGSARGADFDSYWEFAFYIWKRDIKGEYCERNIQDHVNYIDESGKVRKFYPDFKVVGGYAEVKGIFRPSDQCKMDQHPEIKFYFGNEMKQIVKEVSQHFPKWKQEYMEKIK